MQQLDEAAAILVAAGWTTGLQVAASRDSHPIADVAVGFDGLGRPLESGSIAAWFCATKLVTATMVLTLADEGRISLSETLGESAFDCPDLVRDITVWDILTHQSGLWGDAAEGFMLQDSAVRMASYRAMRRRRRRPFEGVYGEFVAFDLLGHWLEARLDTDIGSLVDEYVLGPAGITDGLSLRTNVDDGRLVVSSALTVEGNEVPMLAEALTESVSGGSTANGAYGTARGFAALGRYVLASVERGDTSLAVLGQRCTRPGRDPVLGRRCSYSAGLWFDLPHHGFAGLGLSPRSFGIAGLGGAATVVIDPATRMVLAWRDMTVHTEADRLDTIRNRLVDAAAAAAGPDEPAKEVI